jgi:carbamoyltransferase
VTEASNPRYYQLIKAFEAIRGVPMVLNTSFNVMGEPIVHTPADALKCFYGTGMDAVAMGDFLVVK